MFYAHVEEMGEGCDYTIGCGHRLVKLKATTREEAEREVMQDDSEGEGRYFGSHWYLFGERTLRAVTLLDVRETYGVDLEKHRAAYRDASALGERAAKEAAERAEFARLKAKFG